MGNNDVLRNDLDPLLKSFNSDDEIDDKSAEELIEEKLEEYRAPTVDFHELKALDEEDGLEKDFLEARKVLVDTIDRAKKIATMAFEAMIVKNGDPVLLGIAGDSNKTVQASIKSLVDLHMQTHKIVHQKLRIAKEKNEEPEEKEDDGSKRFASIGGIPTMIPKENKS